MILLTIPEVQMLHAKLIQKTGGMDGLLDKGLLESAVYSADISFGDVEKYPSTEEKAARLAYALICNHAFLDGNKRIGILVMLTTLKLNQIPLSYTQKELIELGFAVASGISGYEDILKWIQNHK